MFTRTKIVSTAPRRIGVYIFDDDPSPVADDEPMDIKYTSSSSPNPRSTKPARGDGKKPKRKR